MTRQEWIHQGCAKEDLNPEYVLVRPLQYRSHTPCSLCGQTDNVAYLYLVDAVEVAEKPTDEVLAEALEIAKEVVLEAIIKEAETVEEEPVFEASKESMQSEIDALRAKLTELEK